MWGNIKQLIAVGSTENEVVNYYYNKMRSEVISTLLDGMDKYDIIEMLDILNEVTVWLKSIYKSSSVALDEMANEFTNLIKKACISSSVDRVFAKALSFRSKRIADKFLAEKTGKEYNEEDEVADIEAAIKNIRDTMPLTRAQEIALIEAEEMIH